MMRCMFAVVAFILAGTAHAGIPMLNVTCGSDIEVHADEGGPVFVNGREYGLKKVNDRYYEAKKGDTTISIAINPDGSPNVSYTGAHGVNGVCTGTKSGHKHANHPQGIPLFNVTCGKDIEVHADQGGPVYVNGKEYDLKKVNDQYYEAKRGETTISIALNPDGSPNVSYDGPHGANGVCR